jgi:hypothetical protein
MCASLGLSWTFTMKNPESDFGFIDLGVAARALGAVPELGVRLRMTLSQESIERWLVVFRELGFCRFPHDAIVGDDSRSVERSLLDQFPTYPPQKKANKSVEDNGRGGLCRSFHVIRELREVTERRCPPVPPLLRYICASSRAPDPRCSPPRCAH